MSSFDRFDLLFDPSKGFADEYRESLVRKLKEFAESHGEDVTLAEFCKGSGVEAGEVIRKFGRWCDFREAAGLPAHGKRRGWNGYSDGEILEALRGVVSESGEEVTLAEFTRRSGVSVTAVVNHFGGYQGLRREAGLGASPRRRRRFSDVELLEEFQRVVEELGRIPTGDEFDRLGRVAMSTLYRRFGGKGDVVRRYEEYLRARGEDGG